MLESYREASAKDNWLSRKDASEGARLLADFHLSGRSRSGPLPDRGWDRLAIANSYHDWDDPDRCELTLEPFADEAGRS